MQCKLQFGTNSKLCQHYPRQNEVCRALWCQRNGRECKTKFLPAAEGTPCGKDKWCRKGSCIPHEFISMKVMDGDWSTFTPWSICSRSCGGGLTVRERFCNSPPPANGGNFCNGEGKEYKICNIQKCDAGKSEHQCSTFNKRAVKGKLYKWKPYSKDLGALSRCRIYCVPDKEDLYLVLSTKLQDGTSCSGNYSSVCVEGECKVVGCDGKIESNVVPDRCGVCSGNNSTCKTIRGTFIASNLSIGYHEVVRVPPLSRHINITESDETSSYLAIKSSTGKYQLNGNWTLNWPGRYTIVGTLISYRRWSGKPESLLSKGPIDDELIVEVLVQEVREVVIHYEFVVSFKQHQWTMQNSTCSLSCGNGTLISRPVCVNSSGGIVNNSFCDAFEKSKNKILICHKESCPPKSRWIAGKWSACNSNSCDPEIQSREVYCIEKGVKVIGIKCVSQNLPVTHKECPKNHCQYEWYTGTWSKCRGKCFNGFQTRLITYRRSRNGTSESFANCKEDLKPPHMRKCKRSNCNNSGLNSHFTWVAGPWSKCKGDCGKGEQERNVTCIRKLDGKVQSISMCKSQFQPFLRQICLLQSCNSLDSANCEESHHWCAISSNYNLCKLKFYSKSCCKSCRNR